MEIQKLSLNMRKIIFFVSFLLICINILYCFSGVMNFPIQSMDLYSNWLLKAKAFYYSTSFPYEFFQSWDNMSSHPQYPILLPLTFSAIYKALGGIHEQNILLIYPLIYSVILFLCFKTVRRLFSFSNSLFLSYIYSMFPVLLSQAGRGHAGNADIILALILWTIVSLIYKANITTLKVILISLLIMLASQIKSEGVFFVILFFFLPLSMLKKITLMTISTIPFLVWNVFVYSHHFASDIYVKFPGLSLFFQRLIIVIWEISQELLKLNNWYIFWPLFFLLITFKPKLSQEVNKIFIPSLLIMLLLYCCVYVFGFFSFSTINTSNYVSSSFDRILLQLSPIIFLWFSEMLLFGKPKTQKSQTIAKSN